MTEGRPVIATAGFRMVYDGSVRARTVISCGNWELRIRNLISMPFNWVQVRLVVNLSRAAFTSELPPKAQAQFFADDHQSTSASSTEYRIFHRGYARDPSS